MPSSGIQKLGLEKSTTLPGNFKGNRMKKITLIAASISMLNGHFAIAQPGSSDDSASLEEVVVTATRRAQAISDVPQAVQALSGEDLTNMNINTVDELLTMVPSATYASTIGAGSTVYQMRGIAASETDSCRKATISAT